MEEILFYTEYTINNNNQIDFEIKTLNNPLTYVFKTAKLDATAQRWVAQLEPYDMRVEYRPGTNNVVADALSRKYDDEEFDNTQHIQQWARTLCEGFDSDRSQHLAATTVKDTTDTTHTIIMNCTIFLILKTESSFYTLQSTFTTDVLHCHIRSY